MKRFFLTWVVAAVLTGVPAVAADRHVVLISVDGMSSDFYLRADELGLKIPNLRHLMKEGSYAEGVQSIMPSLTFPAHISLVTGVSPVKHGVVSNGIFDPGYRKGAGPYNFYEDITARTLFDAVADKGLKSGSVWWPVTMSAPIAYNLPDLEVTDVLRARLVLHLSSPEVRALVPDPEAIVGMGGADELDGLRTRIALDFLRRKPAFLAIHFTELDTAEHDHGPRSPEALAALEKTDAYIGEILATVREAGMEASTTVAVASDHGFLPVEKEVRVGSLFAALGLLDVNAEGVLADWRAFPWHAGGSSAIYIHPQAPSGTAALVDKAIDLLASRPERPVHKVYRGEELARLSGFPGAYAVLDAASGVFFSSRLTGPVTSDTSLRGVHGHTPDRPELSASFLIRGPKIRAGQRIGKVNILDVAPTLARILDVDLGPVEGRVLEEIFQ